MGIFGGLLIVLGIGAVVLGFLTGPLFGFAGLATGLSLAITGCILVGLDRIHQAVRESSAAEIRVLKTGFEHLGKHLVFVAKRLEPAAPVALPPLSAAVLSPTLAPSRSGRCPDCGIYRVQDGTSCVKCGSIKPVIA